MSDCPSLSISYIITSYVIPGDPILFFIFQFGQHPADIIDLDIKGHTKLLIVTKHDLGYYCVCQ